MNSLIYFRWVAFPRLVDESYNGIRTWENLLIVRKPLRISWRSTGCAKQDQVEIKTKFRIVCGWFFERVALDARCYLSCTKRVQYKVISKKNMKNVNFRVCARLASRRGIRSRRFADIFCKNVRAFQRAIVRCLALSIATSRFRRNFWILRLILSKIMKTVMR